MTFIICLSLLQLDMIFPDTAYAFFSHTHKAQKENMPLLDKVDIFIDTNQIMVTFASPPDSPSLLTIDSRCKGFFVRL